MTKLCPVIQPETSDAKQTSAARRSVTWASLSARVSDSQRCTGRPPTPPADERRVNKPAEKRERERERAKRGGKKSDHIKVAGSDSVTTLVTKINPINWEERVSAGVYWQRGARGQQILPDGSSPTRHDFWLPTDLLQRWLKAGIIVGRIVRTFTWNSNIGQISTSKEHVTPWLTYSTSIIFLFSCPVIWNLSWQSEVLFSLSQFSR